MTTDINISREAVERTCAQIDDLVRLILAPSADIFVLFRPENGGIGADVICRSAQNKLLALRAALDAAEARAREARAEALREAGCVVKEGDREGEPDTRRWRYAV